MVEAAGIEPASWANQPQGLYMLVRVESCLPPAANPT